MSLTFRCALAVLLVLSPGVLGAQESAAITIVALQHVLQRATRPAHLYLRAHAQPSDAAEHERATVLPPDTLASLTDIAAAVGAFVAPYDVYSKCVVPRMPAPECVTNERIGVLMVSRPAVSGTSASLVVTYFTRDLRVPPESMRMSVAYVTYHVTLTRRGRRWVVTEATRTSVS